MDGLDSKQLWRQIPPEEKFALMAEAQSKGMISAIGLIIVGATLSVGLHISSLLWISILMSPIVFQGTATKTWRHVKPRAMLEYLAARSASRRFAFSLNSSKLTIASIVRAKIEEVSDYKSDAQNNDEDFENENKKKDVWVALFYDALIVISEQAGGAKLELGQLLMKGIEIEGGSPSGQGEYANDRELSIQTTSSLGTRRKFTVTSKFPAALVVLEKQAQKLITQARQEHSLLELEANKAAEAESEPESQFGLY